MSKDYEPPIRCRIAVLNEFRNNYAFIDFKKFGITRSSTAGWVAWPHKGYVEKDDRICVFLNYEQVCKTTARVEAEAALEELIGESPPEMRGFIEDEKYKLYRALGYELTNGKYIPSFEKR